NKSENGRIKNMANDTDLLLKVTDHPGPTGILRQYEETNSEQIELAASIVARYSDAKKQPLANVKVYNRSEEILHTIQVKPMAPDEVPASI
ncbi:MAG: tRNA 4-thiouridine(8) synthase ThiI, partial [Syntrophomonadaceae bacterium]|nr:tRNA 4-thiouridine(8) synthase ThiI [Syntrophomonadaceae bacterium]